MSASAIVCKPLTRDLWPAFEDLFGPERGGMAGCWCLWPRLPRAEWKAMSRAERKAGFHAVVETGPPPGILALAGEQAVGWCAVGPRPVFRRFETARVSRPVAPDEDRSRVYALTCFYMRSAWRGRGLMRPLAEAAIAFARANGAKTIEVCAIEADRALTWGDGFVGIASVFRALGFREIARRSPRRPLMRLDL